MGRRQIYKQLIISWVAGCLLLSSVPHAFARADKYFSKTKSGANIYVAPYVSDIQKVAIMPFKAPTELIGSSVSDLFITEMLRAGRYTLVERGQMAKVLGETELALAGLSDAKAVELGELVGADGVIVGTVPEYASVAHRGKTYPVVAVSLRLIDCQTGEVVWSADLARKAQKGRNGIPTLTAHASRVVHELTAGLYQAWMKQKRGRRKVRRRISQEETSAPVAMKSGLDVPPEMPTQFSVSDLGLREVVLTWGSYVDHPKMYQVERSALPNGPFEAIDRVSPSKRRYVDRGRRNEPLQDSATYYYRLVAISEGGLKSPTTPVLESMTAPPPDPPNISLEVGGSRAVSVTWEPSTSEGVTIYIVERAPATKGVAFIEIARTEKPLFFDGGTQASALKDDTAYLYRVTSINRVGSVGSPGKAKKIKTLPPPAPVEDFVAENEQVRCVPLRWSASEEPDVMEYRIYQRASSAGDYELITTVEGRSSTYYLAGERDPGSLKDNTTYYYKIVAKNSVGSVSADSEVVSATTKPPPPVVTGVATESDRPREVLVSWDGSPDQKVKGYEVWRSREEEEPVMIVRLTGRGSTTYLDRGTKKRQLFRNGDEGLGSLSDGTAYEYRILAYNTANAKSEFSISTSATTKNAPEEPIISHASTDQPRSIEVLIVPNSERDIEKYVLEAADSPMGKFKLVSAVTVEEGTRPTGVHRDLSHGKKQFYRVKAVDADGLHSEWSDIQEGRAKQLPDAPDGVLASVKTEGVDVSWGEPVQSDVVKYRVWKKGFLRSEMLCECEERSCVLEPEKVGKTATLFITAVDEDALESMPSSSVKVDTRTVTK